MRVKDAVGRMGEDLAARHLTALGMTVLERNWRCPQGELDIVARDGADLVVVEVKTRSSAAFGLPAEAVGPAKLARLRRLAARWIDEHRLAGERWPAVRVDVVAVLRSRTGPPHVEHLRGVF